MTSSLHADEFSIDLNMVRKLVDSEFPGCEDLPLKPLVGSGSSNKQFRLGEELLVRLPRQRGGGDSIEKEYRWTAEIGRHLPVAVPDLIHLGEASAHFPEKWAIIVWQQGEHPETGGANSRQGQLRLAIELAEVIEALRGIEIDGDARHDSSLYKPYRGKPLSRYSDQILEQIEACRDIEGLNLNVDKALDIWHRAVDLEQSMTAPDATWFHGDLVAENLLLSGGGLQGVLDFGGLGIGEGTVDLHGAWELFEADAREAFRRRLDVDDDVWLKGRAWALGIAMMTFPYYWSKLPSRVKDRMVMAQAVLADSND